MIRVSSSVDGLLIRICSSDVDGRIRVAVRLVMDGLWFEGWMAIGGLRFAGCLVKDVLWFVGRLEFGGFAGRSAGVVEGLIVLRGRNSMSDSGALIDEVCDVFACGRPFLGGEINGTGGECKSGFFQAKSYRSSCMVIEGCCRNSCRSANGARDSIGDQESGCWDGEKKPLVIITCVVCICGCYVLVGRDESRYGKLSQFWRFIGISFYGTR
ncbi:hypothetical protein NE237_009486 [Protea cynaroides]|uniref:Uncharacterized protein n=1 Tax=Protea cynaroides TaxID=273540 RepID=A0A9Q0KYF7_9MAGN|nr:hypothetical protein NE237_009486 [Protea cynaroides]